MLGKLPLLAAAGLFVVGLVGFVLVGHPTPDWAVAPIASPSAIVQAPLTLAPAPPGTAVRKDVPQTPIEFPPFNTTSTTPTPPATIPATAQPPVLAAGTGAFSPLGPPAEITSTPSPSPTLTPTAPSTTVHRPRPTPTSTIGPPDWGVPSDILETATSEGHLTTATVTPSATATPASSPPANPTAGRRLGNQEPTLMCNAAKTGALLDMVCEATGAGSND
jgi:hypothetical protein